MRVFWGGIENFYEKDKIEKRFSLMNFRFLFVATILAGSAGSVLKKPDMINEHFSSLKVRRSSALLETA